jgi:hypothetical protein
LISFELGFSRRQPLSAGMIQTTSRLSRGARLRRAKPVWLYGVAVMVTVVLVSALVVLTH